MRRLPGLLLCALLCLPVPLAAEPSAELRADQPQLWGAPHALELLAGEELRYDIGFLWIDRLAEGRFSFQPTDQPGRYQAVLEAQTLGVAAWLTRHRVQRYVAEMEQAPDGRLRTRIFESHIIKGKGSDKKDTVNRYRFDHARGEIVHSRARRGKFYREEHLPMPEGERPQDFLTAFFNFRLGAYGEPRVGSRFEIPTFTHKGPSIIVVEMLPPRSVDKGDFFPRDGLLSRIELSSDIFDTEGGHIYAWFDPFGRPARAIVENVIGMGDVRGSLR